MKGKRKALIIVMALICVLCTAAAVGCSQEKTYYTVTFMNGQTQVGEPIRVEKGKRIAAYPSAERGKDDYLDGWCTDEALTREWNAETERVIKDITLYARFLHITEAPGNVAMSQEAFSNTLTWLQRGVTDQTVYSVALFAGEKVSKTEYAYAGEASYFEENCPYTVENYKGEPDIFKVNWTAAEKPEGGVYAAKISCGTDAVTEGNLLYKGAGTEENPYLINDKTDFAAINTADVSSESHYKLLQSITVRVASSKVAGFTFDGVLDGNGKTVTVEASDCGLFATVGENAYIYDLNVGGSIPGVSENCAGAVCAVNNGYISYCNVSVSITSDLGTIGLLETDGIGITGGAGGVAGVNNGTIANCAYTGDKVQIQAYVGAGGIAAVNRGVIVNCKNGATLGAVNAAETGSSTKRYSYMGGIAAVNYGTISQCATTGSGKLLAQRSESGESPNNNIGGIVAVNAEGAAITECWFDGIRVHGNKNVGGIAGENAGSISFCFAAAVYKSGSGLHSYVGGYSDVGGIVGLSRDTGTVENCFVTANVYAYRPAAYGVAQRSKNSIYLGGNLDLRQTEGITAPIGEGNLLVAVTDEDRTAYATSTYILSLTEKQLILLNGTAEGGKFGVPSNTVRLVCENFSTVKTHTVTVILHGVSEEIYQIDNISGKTVPLSKNNAPAAEIGSYLAGWSMKEGGEIVFGTKAAGYSELEELGLSEVNLYPVYLEGEDPFDKILDVAVYAQWIDEDIIRALIGAFEIYCAENGIAVEEFRYTMIGNSNTNVSSFCTAVSQGEYNVIFGQRANLTITVIGNQDTLLKVDGSARRIAKLSEGTASGAFYDFVLGNPAAKKILDPAYITEEEADKIKIMLMNGNVQYGELTVSNATDAANVTLPEITEIPAGYTSFAGWALTRTEAENEVLLGGSVGYEDVERFSSSGSVTLYARFSAEAKAEIVLRVAVYKRYMPEAEYAEKLISSFCTANDLEADQIVLDFLGVSNTGAADFGKLVNEGNYDIVIACGNNIDSANGCNVTIKEKKSIDVKGQSNRYIACLTETETAQTFYAFIETDEAKVALNPDYVPADQEQYDLVIAIHSTSNKGDVYVSNDEIENLKSLFVQYLTDKGHTSVAIDWVVVTDKDVAGFGGDVSANGSVNAAVGGNTMNTTGGISFDGTYKKADVKAGLFASTNRKAGVLSGSGDNLYAQLFYRFITGTEE